MKFCVFLIVCVVAILGRTMKAQPSPSYLQYAYDSALEVIAEYSFERNYFRALLTWESNNVGAIFVSLLADGIDEIQTPEQGEEMRRCAESTATTSQNYLNRMDDLIGKLEDDMSNLHQTVYGQLMDMNIKQEDIYLFYYYHSLRMEDAMQRLEDHHYILHDAYTDIYFSFFDEFYALEECINNVVNLK